MINSGSLRIAVFTIERKPLAKAKVIINKETEASEISPGVYETKQVRTGNALIEVVAEGMETQSRTVAIKPGINKAEFILAPPGLPWYTRKGVRVPFQPYPGKLAIALRGKSKEPAFRSKMQQMKFKEYKKTKGVIIIEAEPEKIGNSIRELRNTAEIAEAGPIAYLSNKDVAFFSGRIILHVKPDTPKEKVISLAKETGLEIKRKMALKDFWLLISSAGGLEILDQCHKLEDNNIVISAEPDLGYTSEPDAITPEDELVDEQWHIPLINLPDAWQTLLDSNPSGVTPGSANDRQFGSAGVVIAVIDEGLQSQTDGGGNVTPTHPDFQGNVTNGQPKIVQFYDFGEMAANNDDPLGSHGIQCSGVAAAIANNVSPVAGEEEGVAGAAPNCRLLSVQVPPGGTETEYSDIYLWMSGIDPESDTPGFPALPARAADVITNSAGGYNPATWPISDLMNETFNRITDDGRGGAGTLLFFSAGNGYSDNFHLQRPWANHERTFGIGASNENEQKSAYSNWGEGIDLCAPSSDDDSGLRGIITTYTPGGGNLAGHTGGPEDYTDNFGGTSSATPLTAGVAALMVSINPNLTWQQVRDIFYNTAVKIDFGNTDPDGAWRDRDGDGINEYSDWYGYGRIDAAKAVSIAEEIIQLDTPSVQFIDVPEEEPTLRAVSFTVKSYRNLTFLVTNGPNTTSGPANSFVLHNGNQATHTGNYTGTITHPRIWIRYTGTEEGDTALGNITVECVETGEIYNINISANTIRRPRAALVLAMDRSGSMNDPAGDGRLKIDVLHDSAIVVPALAQEDTGLGAVSWDTDADLAGATAVQDAGMEIIGGGRAALNAHISAHNTNLSGMTAIGDAVMAAQSLLNDASSDYEVKAMVVLTDGNETESLYLSELPPGSITGDVFAIGLGTPENIQPAALSTLTGGNNGYILMTGNISVDEYFLLTKYYQQILAGVSNMQIVVDPDGWISPGDKVRIPFRINETDWRFDAVLHTPFPKIIQFLLEAPDGSIIDPASLSSEPVSKFVVEKASSFYRISLPLSTIGAQNPAGLWHAILKIDRQNPTHGLLSSGYDKRSKEYRLMRSHGLRYSFVVQARSALDMKVRLTQAGLEPGASVHLRVNLTEYGFPSRPGADVNVMIRYPDNSSVPLLMKETGDGIFEGEWTASLSGVYNVHVKAKGITTRNSKWTREALRSAFVWKGGNNPPPGPSITEQLCRKLKCLEKLGLKDHQNLHALAECMCGKKKTEGKNLQHGS